jgi:PhzF family phenazine biosynthesis protein
MKLNFWYVDVFSSERFKGNPAAVFFEADDLDEKIMAKIANELNLSETVFLQKKSNELASYKARIFTPKTELPFAGHPTIAAAFSYKNFYDISSDELIQECGAGLIKINKRDSIYFVTQKDPEFKNLSHNKDSVSIMLGIESNKIADLPISKISTGIYWAVIMLDSSESVSEVKPDYEKIISFCDKEQLVGLQIFSKSKDNKSDIHVRTFAPIVGVFEDPSCGSGNGCIASYIAKYNILPNKINYIASQGKELGRESKIYASFAKNNDKISQIKIGGDAVKVLEGSIEI